MDHNSHKNAEVFPKAELENIEKFLSQF